MAWVAHDDLAEVIATLAADAEDTTHDGEILEVTGPESLSLAEVTAKIAQASGRDYRYVPQTLAEGFDLRLRNGISGEQIDSWLSWYQTVASGRLDFVTSSVADITGHPATPVEQITWWPEPRSAW